MTRNIIIKFLFTGSVLLILSFILLPQEKGVEINDDLNYPNKPTTSVISTVQLTKNMVKNHNNSVKAVASSNSVEDYFYALNQAMELSNDIERTKKVTAVLVELSTLYTMQDALYWLSTQEQTTEIGEYYYRLLKIYMNENLNEAGDIILTLSSFDAKESIIKDYVYQLSLQDPYRALAWADNLMESDLKSSAQQNIFKTWVESSPKQALDYLSSFSDLEPNLKSDIINTAANRLSQQSYQETAQALYQYPVSYRGKIAYSVISHWPKNKMPEAVDWLKALDNSPTKDLAIKSYVDLNGIEGDLNNTFELIESIVDHQLRSSLTKRTFSAWYQRSPNAALTGVDGLSYLTSQQKKSLIESAKTINTSPRYH